MRKVRWSVCIALIGSLLSCATSSVQTNKDVKNIKPLDKVYVVINTPDAKLFGSKSANIGAALRAIIEQELTQRGVQTKAVQLSGLEVGESNLEKEITSFGASSVLTVEMNNGFVNGFNVLISGDLIVSIINVSSGSSVWKAQARFKDFTNYGISEATIKDAAGKIFASMKSDGLFLQATSSAD